MPETITKLHCAKCGHEWWPRVPNPKTCPNCGNNWREERKRPPMAVQRQKAAERKRIEELVLNPALAVPSRLVRYVPTVMDVPCGEPQEFARLLEEWGEPQPVEVTGRLAELVTEHSFVVRAAGWSMAKNGGRSSGARLPGINDDDRLLMTPFDEYHGMLHHGTIVLAQIRYKNHKIGVTLKEYAGDRLRATNPKFPGVSFGKEVESAVVYAVCRGKLETVFE